MSKTDLGKRLLWGAGAAVIATFAYRTTQFLTVEHATVRAECWTWTWLPFHPAWLWPYVSMFVIVGLPWFCLPEWRQVRRFAFCLLGMAAVGWVVFLVHPTACARTASAESSWAYALLVALDRPNNCLPCLHSAMAVLAAGVLAQHAPAFHSGPRRLLLGLWCAGIAAGIIGLRQHTDIDTLVGCLLGGAAWWAYARSSTSQPDVPAGRARA